jgi:uncharacterized membrane protein
MEQQTKDTTDKTDHDAEMVIGTLLRVGVTLSSIVVLCGGVFYLFQFGMQPPHHQIFRGEPADLRTIPGITREALSGNSRGIIQIGLLLLIGTPIARVIFSVYAFARSGDHLYVGITIIVLLTLLASLFSV